MKDKVFIPALIRLVPCQSMPLAVWALLKGSPSQPFLSVSS
jgi:hypothetical protein